MTDKLTCGECPWMKEFDLVGGRCQAERNKDYVYYTTPECFSRRAYRILKEEVRRLRGVLDFLCPRWKPATAPTGQRDFDVIKALERARDNPPKGGTIQTMIALPKNPKPDQEG